jgi:hypothetical protein
LAKPRIHTVGVGRIGTIGSRLVLIVPILTMRRLGIGDNVCCKRFAVGEFLQSEGESEGYPPILRAATRTVRLEKDRLSTSN